MSAGRVRDSDARAPTTSRYRKVFLDQTVDDEFAASGYAVLGERLGSDAVRSLAALYRSAIDNSSRDDSGRFLPSMMIASAELRRSIWDGVGAITRSSLPDIFVPGAAEVFGGSFVSKPSDLNSARDPHQDPTTSDEANAVSLSLWIPLSDSDQANGSVHVLPGSHRMGNHVRPPDVESLDQEVQRIALEESVPVEIVAGSVLVIDGALVHHSPPNRSGRERIAAIAAVRAVGASMRYVRSDAGRSSGLADVFQVPVEMYRSRDLVSPDLGDASHVEQIAYEPVTSGVLRASQSETAGARPIRSGQEVRTSSGGSLHRAAWRRRIARR